MRLKDYLAEDIEEFRKLRIGLVRENTDKREVVSKISKEFDLKLEAISDIDNLNKELKRHYTGTTYRIDLCLQEDLKMEALKLKREVVKESLMEVMIKANDALAKAKTELERKLSSDD